MASDKDKMRNILLSIEYDGTNYHGWQIQPNGITVQEVIENKLFELTKEKINIASASRTDAKVHALDQKATFRTSSNIPLKAFHLGLNSILPFDIRIKEASLVSEDFNARVKAKQKTYHYYFTAGNHAQTIFRNYAWFIKQKVNWQKIQACFKYIEGTHNFKSFQASDCVAKTTIRTIDEIKYIKKDFHIPIDGSQLHCISIKSKGFMKHMVRNIVGTLMEVGIGKRKPEDIKIIIEAEDRTKAGICAPGWGLFLIKIEY
ncbi:MAG: tRNA pseudouridine(38-40) synthase TruA [Pseudomonadota bacterium]